MNVLIIDDDAPWANLAAVIVKKVAARVKIATSWAEALATIAKPNGYDVVVLDLNLRDLPPDYTMNHVDEILSTGRKIVLVTGIQVNEFMQNAARAHGAKGIFYKGDIHLADKLLIACQ